MNSHKEQRELLRKSITALETALSYLQLAEGYSTSAINALAIEYNPADIKTLIEKAKVTYGFIGYTLDVEHE